MFRIMVKDIKDTWKSLVYLTLQITLIFMLFFVYIREIGVMEVEETKIQEQVDTQITYFSRNLWYSVGDIYVDAQNIVAEESEYLEKLFDSGKAYTAFKSSFMNIEYPVIVVVGDAWASLESEVDGNQYKNQSGAYIGSEISEESLETGKTLKLNSSYASMLGKEELSQNIEILGKLETGFTLPNITYRETLDRYIVVQLTLQDYQKLFANHQDTNFLVSMIMKNASREEIIEYINKFSYYPYRIIRQADNNANRTYLKEVTETYQNITLYLVFSFAVSMVTLYVLLKKIFIRKYQELMVAEIYGSGWGILFFRMIFLILLVFIGSMLLAYNILLKYAEINYSYYLFYLFILLCFSIGYTFLFIRSVRVNDGKL